MRMKEERGREIESEEETGRKEFEGSGNEEVPGH